MCVINAELILETKFKIKEEHQQSLKVIDKYFSNKTF